MKMKYYRKKMWKDIVNGDYTRVIHSGEYFLYLPVNLIQILQDKGHAKDAIRRTIDFLGYVATHGREGHRIKILSYVIKMYGQEFSDVEYVREFYEKSCLSELEEMKLITRTTKSVCKTTAYTFDYVMYDEISAWVDDSFELSNIYDNQALYSRIKKAKLPKQEWDLVVEKYRHIKMKWHNELHLAKAFDMKVADVEDIIVKLVKGDVTDFDLWNVKDESLIYKIIDKERMNLFKEKLENSYTVDEFSCHIKEMNVTDKELGIWRHVRGDMDDNYGY